MIVLYAANLFFMQSIPWQLRSRLPPLYPNFSVLTVRHLNRLILEPEEIVQSKDHNFCKLCADDPRTKHVREVLKSRDGDSIRVGVVDAGSCDQAAVKWLSAEGESSQSLQLFFEGTDILTPVPEECRPRVDLLLALPRPLQLDRMLPMISSLGVNNLILTNASKVEKSYFGCHLLRFPDAMRKRLSDGCSQSGMTCVPRVKIVRQLKCFLEDHVEALFPLKEYVRVIAHPRNVQGIASKRFMKLEPPVGKSLVNCKLLIAVGPEGGWEEPYELELFHRYEFQSVSLGERILRSDVAVNSLLALSHEWLQRC